MTWKAISLWQPWASLWCSDAKEHETRHWPTRYRGPLLVHAAQRFERDFGGDPIEAITADYFGSDWRRTLPTGALIGIVNIVGCRPVEDIMSGWGCPPCPVPMAHWADYQCGNWEDGRFGWRRSDAFELFETPIPWRGLQGFFDVPDDVVAGRVAPVPAQRTLFE